MAQATRGRPESARTRPEAQRRAEQHKPANGFGRHGGEYGCERAAQGVTEKERFAVFVFAGDFHDALADGLSVSSKAVVTGRP
jgi:hypothetical protein